jgi:hypothetical protein
MHNKKDLPYPEAKSTKSPGTSNVGSISSHFPLRLQVAVGFKLFFEAATAFPALFNP